MKPLFETQTEYTFEKYSEFCKVIYTKVSHTRTMIIVMDALLLLMAFFYLWGESYEMFGFFFLAAFFFPVLLIWQLKKKIEKAWKSNQSAQGLVSRYLFYEDRVEQSNALGKTTFAYEKLYRIVETKNNVYLMIGNNQGMILDKANCSEELLAFVRGLKSR